MTTTNAQANRCAREGSVRRMEVSFESGGMSCAATVYRPDSATGLVGCVVMGNGMTLTRADGIPDYATRCADAGFAVLAFDYRHWARAVASRGAGSRSLASSRTGGPPSVTPAGWRARTLRGLRCGGCRSEAGWR
jgi:hypothetical protein